LRLEKNIKQRKQITIEKLKKENVELLDENEKLKGNIKKLKNLLMNQSNLLSTSYDSNTKLKKDLEGIIKERLCVIDSMNKSHKEQMNELNNFVQNTLSIKNIPDTDTSCSTPSSSKDDEIVSLKKELMKSKAREERSKKQLKQYLDNYNEHKVPLIKEMSANLGNLLVVLKNVSEKSGTSPKDLIEQYGLDAKLSENLLIKFKQENPFEIYKNQES
jgi:cell division protein FtsB